MRFTQKFISKARSFELMEWCLNGVRDSSSQGGVQNGVYDGVGVEVKIMLVEVKEEFLKILDSIS
jgi:hypothetical protein